jgi:hypothetical protein
MNPLTPEKKILESFKAAMASSYPARVVTRSLKDFADRKKQELEAGIYTIIADGLPAGEVYFQTMKFIVVGQIQLGEKALGEQVEDAELLMIREIRNLIQRQLRGPELQIKQVDQSAQLEVPYGWVSVHIEAGPYDATEPLTEDEKIGNLTDFLTFKVAIDIGKPHQSASEHAKWASDPPDHSTSKPDLQSETTLPRSTA